MVRANVESDDNGLGGRGQHDVGLGDRPRGLDHIDFDDRGHLFQGFADGFDGPLDISLKDNVEFFDLSFLDLFVELFQSDFAGFGKFGLPLFLERKTPICLAVFSSSTTTNSSPAWGTPLNP